MLRAVACGPAPERGGSYRRWGPNRSLSTESSSEYTSSATSSSTLMMLASVCPADGLFVGLEATDTAGLHYWLQSILITQKLMELNILTMTEKIDFVGEVTKINYKGPLNNDPESVDVRHPKTNRTITAIITMASIEVELGDEVVVRWLAKLDGYMIRSTWDVWLETHLEEVAKRSGASCPESRRALRKAGGDLAEAVALLEEERSITKGSEQGTNTNEHLQCPECGTELYESVRVCYRCNTDVWLASIGKS